MARKRRPPPRPAADAPFQRRPACRGAGRRAGTGRGSPPWLLLAARRRASACGWRAARRPQPAAPAPTAAALPEASYVDNTQCLGCHQTQATAWAGSHHAKAMAPATADSVRGDFDNTQFRHQGVTSRFFKRGDKFFVHTDGPDGKLADFEIKYTFGVEPLQQYLIDIGNGRLQPLQIAWNTRERKWFHLLPHEKAPPGDVLHWTGRYQTANTMCIACHTTGFDKRYDAQADRFDSRWHEVNVSCQSCHGPGSRHVACAAAARAAGGPEDAAQAGRGLRRLPFAPRRTQRPRRCRASRTWTTTCPACCARACTTPTASSSTRSSSAARSARARCTAWA